MYYQYKQSKQLSIKILSYKTQLGLKVKLRI